MEFNMNVKIYDFDKTIYDGDSSIDFFIFCLKKKFIIIMYLPKFLIYVLLYKLKIKTKEMMKEQYFSFLKSFSNIDSIIEEFWELNKRKIKRFYLEKKHDNDIIISASPMFLLAPICKELDVMDLIATNVDKKTGKFKSKNCYGNEKVNRFISKYPNTNVIEVYSDSLSDLPLFNISKKKFLVKGDNITEIK